ncbi:16S rRNA (uracil(1498)-N(3))-methyltransferase [bacterium]|nr:16S rRNA (uracil(1498)-N(3))-methyltransferase [bacterium]
MKSPIHNDQYFYVIPEDVNNRQSVILRGEEAFHCTKVLRKKAGDRFFAVDGSGNEYLVELEEAHKDTVTCHILDSKTRPTELSSDITLAQALIKNDHFDLVVEKCTELGVNTIIPLETERSLADPGKNKFHRWQKIMLSSMKQSRRSVLPRLNEVTPLDELVEKSNHYDVKIIFHEKSDRPVFDFTKNIIMSGTKILVLVGPEGGFTESEHRTAVSHDFISLSLGRRRLRAETAAISAIGIFSNLYTPQNT